eukprot:1160885-Pelagomonas_calceolata.AAC.4
MPHHYRVGHDETHDPSQQNPLVMIDDIRQLADALAVGLQSGQPTASRCICQRSSVRTPDC